MKTKTFVAAVGGLGLGSYAAYVATTWFGFGRPRAARGAAADPLLDTFMPRYDVCDRHALELAAPADATWRAAKQLDLEASPIVRAVFRAREWIYRSPHATVSRASLVERLGAIGWGVLAETSSEIVMGAATRPWLANPVFRPLAPTAFAGFAEPDYVKIAWTLRADPGPDGGSTFRTETRAVATDVEAARKFRTYWSLLSPGIVAIRVALLPQLARAADRAWVLPGDEMLAHADAQLTHAITIAAPPEKVWPWLLQMGGQRGGWYSWDRLDNAGKPSADRIIPELQHLALGDVLPMRPEGPEGFEVIRIDPQRALVLRGGGPKFDGTWAFVLEPLPGATRLVTRYRAAFHPGARVAATRSVMPAVHAFMERKQLRTIKHHAEQRSGER